VNREKADFSESFPEIEALMPHRGVVVLLDRVLRHAADETEARVSIGKQRWLKREDGSVASWLAVEYMAQCVAAHEGLLALAEGRPPPQGFLVGVTALRVEVAEFEADAELRVRSGRLRGSPSLGALSHRCELFIEAAEPRGERESGSTDTARRPVAEARLSVSVARESRF
jgi:predicted hotdog family 3-hydroxylacyl-ACP dehydratase